MRLRTLALAAALLSVPAAGAQTIFQFNGNLNAQTGAGTLAFRGDAASVSSFVATGGSIPVLPGGAATVLQFPAYSQTQGLLLQNASPANGGGAFVNQYTFGFDVLFPTINNFSAFYQTAGDNPDGNDADFYLNDTAGIGISGSYHGTVAANTWNRIMVTVDTTGTPTMTKYINGALVGTTTLGAGVDGRWSLYTATDTVGTALFTEGDTSGVYVLPGYINSLFFQDRVLSAAEIGAFGGPTAAGFQPIPEPSALALASVGAAGGLWRWRRRKA